MQALRCRECGQEYELAATYVCEFCFGPLEVAYDYDAIAGQMTRESVAAGPNSMWRYAPLLPVNPDYIISRQEGMTPLVPAPNLGKAIGLNKLFIKNDTVNPTFSFKDRVVACAVSRAREFGYETVSCASTGNLAGSVGAYGAAAGMKAVIFIPDNLEPSKVSAAQIYGTQIVAVRGNYDDVNRLCSEISNSRKWAFVNINLRPYYSEGSKTLAFEVAEQLGWQAPGQVVAPMASGSMYCKIYKGFQELHKIGLIDEPKTRCFGAQAEGCSPIATAFKEDAKMVKPVKPDTIAKSIAIGNPADGIYALDIMRKTDGAGEAVTDQEVVDGIKLLASTEGIYAETAGGVTIGVLKKLAEAGRLDPDATTVAYITGNGLKTQEAVVDHLEAYPTIDANLGSFDEALPESSTVGACA
jgi:threonine synthase